MPINAPITSTIDIRLPLDPENVDDPKVYRDLKIAYNAIRNLQAAINSINSAGTIIDFAGTVAPTGYLRCPLAAGGAQLVSRIIYVNLFNAIGTTWGVGDGTTTFGIPWFPADYAAIQANANVGTNTVGAVISHAHGSSLFQPGASFILSATAGAVHAQGSTDAAGGAANLAAGVRVLKCVKY
jgi:microcystin-dependent protein